MDQITCSYTESSSSSSYDQKHPQNTPKSSYHKSLHSVRKPTTHNQKPATTKHFIAPLPPTPVKIYEVEPSKFKDLVRMLTSAPKFHHPSATRGLKDKAPPPLILATKPKPSLVPKSAPPPPQRFDDDDGGIMSPLSTFLVSPDFYNLLNETMQTPTAVDYFDGLISPVGLDQSGGALISLSPTSLSWCSSVLFDHPILE